MSSFPVAEPCAGRTEVVRPWALRHPVQLALLVAVALGDFANFYVALSVLADEQPVVTFLVVLALTAAAVALAHGVGVQLREDGTAHLGPIAVMTSVWFLLGACATVVRWAAPPRLSTALDVGFGQVTAPVVDHSQQLTSLLLAALYLAGGVLAAWIAYVDHDPKAALRRATWRRRVWTGFVHRRRSARLARAESGLAQHVDERERVLANHAAAVADRGALAEELRQYARLLIATRVGDPVSTEVLLSRPDPSRADR